MITLLLATVFVALLGLLFFENVRSKDASKQALQRASEHLAHGHLEEASHLLSKLKRTPAVIELEIKLLRRTGKLEQVEQFSTTSLTMRSEKAKSLAQQADAIRLSGGLKEALSLYEKALAAQSLPRVQQARADLLVQLSRSQEAEAAYRQLLAKRSGSVSALLGLGTLLEQQQRFDEALALYQGPRIWERGEPKLLRQAGICALHLEQYRFAEQYLRESLARGLRSAKTFAYLGYSLECQTRWDQSQEVYWELTRRYPTDAAGYRGLAWLFGVGRSRDLEAPVALRMARRGVELLPDVSSWEILSACEARVGNFAAAQQIQERLASQEGGRHLEAIETLRSGQLLGEQHLVRTLVA